MQLNKKYILIEPISGWQMIDLDELIKYRDLLYFMVVRGIRAKYAQSVLGISWAIIQPLFTTLIFTIVFGYLAKIDSNGAPYAVFSFAAMVPWTFFSNTLIDASNSLVANANMINKVYFPRLLLPVAAALSKFVDFLISFTVFICFLLYYRMMPSIDVLFLPLLLLQLFFFSVGIGLLLSALSVTYRDVKHAVGFLVQFLMYATPVVYATSAVPEKYRLIYSCNPMVGVIEGFRSIFLHTIPMPWLTICCGFITSIIFFVLGLLYFKKMEKFFADVA
jgi:lipopolysaccharide transport system permease protein